MTKIIGDLDWISNRLTYKYKESSDSEIFQKIETIKTYIVSRSESKIQIDKQQLDQILSKYYADFYLDSSDYIQIGYTEQQRENIRASILSMSQEILDCSNNEKSNSLNS